LLTQRSVQPVALSYERCCGAGERTWPILDEDFLAVADRPTIYQAIVGVAVAAGRAASVDLQLYDRKARVLRLVAQHGFSSRFLAFFAAVGVAQPTACAAAFASCRPVLVDDVTRSAIFVGEPTMEPMLDAGSRAVHSYPLLASPDAVVGVLSFHYRERAPQPGAVEPVVYSAAQLISQLSCQKDRSSWSTVSHGDQTGLHHGLGAADFTLN
jgi:hypothetical protein